MKPVHGYRSLLVSVLVVGGASAPSSARQPDLEGRTAAHSGIVINEVFYGGAPTEDWVELRNAGILTEDVSSWWLCARFGYGQLSALTLLDGSLLLAPGEIVRLGGLALDDAASDLGLYSLNLFAQHAYMIDFVKWGNSNPVGRESVAVQAGLWTQLTPAPAATYDFVPATPAGESLDYCGTESGTGGLVGHQTLSTDFENRAPSPGAPNPPCGSIFIDGFESGTTSSWSGTIGALATFGLTFDGGATYQGPHAGRGFAMAMVEQPSTVLLVRAHDAGSTQDVCSTS